MIHTGSVERGAGNDLVTRGREIFLVLGELDKQLLREEPPRPHAALSHPLLFGLLDKLISCHFPLRIYLPKRRPDPVMGQHGAGGHQHLNTQFM